MSTLSFEPLIAPTTWVTLAALATALLVWYGWSRPAGIARRWWWVTVLLMAAGLACVLFILLNPIWVEPIPPPAGKPLLTLLVDGSASMATEDANGRSRFQAAVASAESLAKLRSRFNVQLRTFAATASPAGAQTLGQQRPDGAVTDLATALSQALKENPPQGQAVVLASDGAHNAPGGVGPVLEVVQTAKAMSVPVYTRTFGGDARLNDLEIALRRPQELAFVGQTVPVTATVRQRGILTDRATVVVEHDGREVARQPARVAGDGSTTVRLDVQQATAGIFRYEVKVEPIDGEVTETNNATSLLLRVVDEPIRVLLLEGKPYWDGKFLIRTLASDIAVELDSLIRVSDRRFFERRLRLSPAGSQASDEPPLREEDPASDPGADGPSGATFQRVETTEILNNPDERLRDAEGLSGYQIIVLGRDAEAFLTDELLEEVRQWISRDGGSLVCYRGSPVAQSGEALRRLLPVRWTPTRESRFRVQLTAEGRDVGWLGPMVSEDEESLLGKLPSLARVAEPAGTRPLTVVLARSGRDQGPPVLTYQPYGTGRVVVVEGAGMWRWAFLPPDYQGHDDVYRSLWQSLLRWLVSSVGLVPGQDLALRVDRVSYTVGEPVFATLLMREERDTVPTVSLKRSGSGDSGDLQEFQPVPIGEEPGVYRVSFGKLDAGRYRAAVLGMDSAEAAAVAFDVRPFYGEQLDVSARPDLMQRIAQESGGSVLPGDDASQVADRFLQHLAHSRPERVRRLTAWDRWWILAAVFALWGICWGVRRSRGLI